MLREESVAPRWRTDLSSLLSWQYHLRGEGFPCWVVWVGDQRALPPNETPEDTSKVPQSLHELESQVSEGICAILATLSKWAITNG